MDEQVNLIGQGMCENDLDDFVDFASHRLIMLDETHISSQHVGVWERTVDEQVDHFDQRAAMLDELCIAHEHIDV